MKKFLKSTTMFFRAMPSIIAFELIYKLLITAIALPILAFILQKAIDISGVGYLTKENFPEFLKEPLSILFILFIFILCSMVTILEISAIISCFAQLVQKRTIRISTMFKSGLLSIKKLFVKWNFQLIIYVMLILPLTQFTLASGIFTSIGLPNTTTLLSIADRKIILIFMAIMGIVLLLMINKIYCLHFFTLTDSDYSQSIAKSKEITSNRTLKTIFSIILWLAFISIIFVSLFFILCFLSALAFKGFSEPEIAFFMSLKTIKVILNVFMAISSLFATPVIFSFITCCFIDETKNSIEIKLPENDNKLKPWKIRCIAYGILSLSIIMNFNFMKNLASGKISLDSGIFTQTKVTAHRGFSSSAPENTEPAFILANEIGADFIELDVQLSADGEIVVIHDDNLLRTANIDELVKNKTHAELLELDFGKWFGEEFSGTKIMRLEDVLIEFGEDISLNIEIKKTGDEIEVAERTALMLEEYDLVNSTYITSFSYNTLKAVKRINPDIKTGLIANIMTYGKYAQMHYIDALSLNQRFVSQNLVNNIHLNGKRIFVWTVNDEYDMERLINMGVDNIITDNPDMAIKSISSHKTEGYIISILSSLFNY